MLHDDKTLVDSLSHPEPKGTINNYSYFQAFLTALTRFERGDGQIYPNVGMCYHSWLIMFLGPSLYCNVVINFGSSKHLRS